MTTFVLIYPDRQEEYKTDIYMDERVTHRLQSFL